MGRGRSRGPYGGRRQGLTGNQLKILGIVAILIDNIGAVVIQEGFFMEQTVLFIMGYC